VGFSLTWVTHYLWFIELLSLLLSYQKLEQLAEASGSRGRRASAPLTALDADNRGGKREYRSQAETTATRKPTRKALFSFSSPDPI
jgi:hypothetical protein